MLRDEMVKYEKLTGENASHVPIMKIGAYLDGYDKGIEILDKIKRDIFNACSDNYHMPVHKLDCDEIFEIIDKYKAEREEKE